MAVKPRTDRLGVRGLPGSPLKFTRQLGMVLKQTEQGRIDGPTEEPDIKAQRGARKKVRFFGYRSSGICQERV